MDSLLRPNVHGDGRLIASIWTETGRDSTAPLPLEDDSGPGHTRLMSKEPHREQAIGKC